MESFLRNVAYAIRGLVRAPGFTITVVLTLAIGIGANSAVFSAIDAVLLRPLPFPDADRLVLVTQIQPGSAETSMAPVRLEDWNRLSSTFEAITGYNANDASDTTGDLPERTRLSTVLPRFLEVWGIVPALGRGFTAAEYQTGGPSAVLISDRYWRNRFGADPNVLGSAVRIEDRSYSVVGVMPASFLFPDRDVDLWLPYPVDSPFLENNVQTRQLTWYTAIGRLEAGVTLDQARSELALVQAQLGEEYPDTDAEIRVGIDPLKETVVGNVRGSLWLVYGAVSVLLLIACTNIAALLLSRAAQREQEIAIRFSLGASRAAVVVQTLTKAAVLAFAGAIAGLLVAVGAFAALQFLAPDLPRLDNVTIDGRILLYLVASAVVVTLLCGLFPAVRNARGARSLSRAGRTQVSPRHSLQWWLVGVQVALSVTLLAGAGLLLRSAQELSRVDPGFDAGRVLTFRMSGNWNETGNLDVLVQRIMGTLDELSALPGVDAASTSVLPPGVPGQFQNEYQLVEGRADTEPRLMAETRFVSPGYFETMQIPMLAGELCRHPDAGASTELMVNRRFAERYFPDRSVIGLQLGGTQFIQASPIVGIVGDAREVGTDRDPVPTVYSCFGAASPFVSFLVRTSAEPLAMAGAIRSKLAELEPLRSVYEMASLEQRIGDAYAQNRLRTVLLALFAVTALSLACLGIYATLSYVVSLRRREVGLRVALGALSSNIVSQFLARALWVVGLACAVGLVLSFAFTRVLSGMLFGVSPTDPATLAGVVVTVTVVAALAALVPAMRAARLDPMQTLREE